MIVQAKQVTKPQGFCQFEGELEVCLDVDVVTDS
jgi:hypothetical protein